MLALLMVPAAASAQSIPSDQGYVRFDRHTAVPGATLEPGEYLFVLGMPVAGQTVIDIYAVGRQQRLVASCLALESRLPRPPASAFIEYHGTDRPALRAWFHPGNAVGFEFVYPASDAKAIYLASGSSVPFVPFRTFNRDLVGTFTVAMTSTTPDVPRPVGTSGTGTLPADAPGVHDHLPLARQALASHLSRTQPPLMRKLLSLVEMIDRLEAAARSGSRDQRRRQLELTMSAVENMLPQRGARFSGVAPLPPDTESVLQRVKAHLRAFADGLR